MQEGRIEENSACFVSIPLPQYEPDFVSVHGGVLDFRSVSATAYYQVELWSTMVWFDESSVVMFTIVRCLLQMCIFHRPWFLHLMHVLCGGGGTSALQEGRAAGAIPFAYYAESPYEDDNDGIEHSFLA